MCYSLIPEMYTLVWLAIAQLLRPSLRHSVGPRRRHQVKKGHILIHDDIWGHSKQNKKNVVLFLFCCFFFLTAANCLYCTNLSTCTEETAILDGPETYTWPRKSSPTSQWVEERCGINLDISKQELASERPSPWGIFPQRWEKKKLQSDTVTCSAQGSSR